jgi:serine/threonine-protein kinase
MDQLSTECQLKFYKVFTEVLIYRLSMTSAKLSAKS